MSSREEFIQNLITSGLMQPDEIQAVLTAIPVADRPGNARSLARYLVKQGLLTGYQTEAIRTNPSVSVGCVLARTMFS